VEKKTETMEIQVKKIQDLEKRMKKEEDSLIVTNKQIESIQNDLKQGKNNLNGINTIFKQIVSRKKTRIIWNIS